jgi:hypothetical protein
VEKVTDDPDATACTVSRAEAVEIQRTYLNLIAARDAADAYRAKLESRVLADPLADDKVAVTRNP